jgi:hypothetical protein
LSAARRLRVPLAARAQQSAMPVIGFLDTRSTDVVADRLRGFRQGLKDNGYVEGDNITIMYRWAENRVDRLPELAASWRPELSNGFGWSPFCDTQISCAPPAPFFLPRCCRRLSA